MKDEKAFKKAMDAILSGNPEESIKIMKSQLSEQQIKVAEYAANKTYTELHKELDEEVEKKPFHIDRLNFILDCIKVRKLSDNLKGTINQLLLTAKNNPLF